MEAKFGPTEKRIKTTDIDPDEKFQAFIFRPQKE
jgi:hypothetical protein